MLQNSLKQGRMSSSVYRIKQHIVPNAWLMNSMCQAGRLQKRCCCGPTADTSTLSPYCPPAKTIDLSKASKLLGGSKLELGTEFDIEKHCPDCEFGVLPPFGSRYGMKTIVDTSLTEDEDIWFEGNTHDEAIRMKFAEFCRLEQPLIAPFAAD
jgi:hypothetical protein